MKTDSEREVSPAEPAPADSGVTAAPPAPTNPGAASDSPPKGDKEPGSISEALAQAKLEEPPKEAGAATEPQPEASPAPETEAAQAAAEQAGKDEHGQPKAAGAAADALSQQFNERPEWKAMQKAVGEAGWKSVKPILRQVLESETRARARAAELAPQAEIVAEFKALTGDAKGFDTMRDIVRTYARDPAAAVPILEQMLTDARQRGGLEITSPDLKARLAEIDQQAHDSLISQDAAKKLRALLVEAEKGRAAARQAEGRLKDHEQSAARTAAQAADAQVMTTLNAWEQNIRSRYPDFGDVTAATDPAHGSSVADQVFDALCLKRMTQPDAGADVLVREADRVLKLALTRVGAPASRTQRPITSQGSSVTAKPRPKTMREAMDSVKLD